MGRAQAIAAGLGHPVPALFHLLFKTLAILVYMFGTWFSSNFVNMFIVCVLLLAFDFWTVKNVTGRLMVGLRWNSEVLEDGSTTWKFEAQEENLNSTTLDHAVFWAGLFAPAPIWLLFGVRSRAREPCCALGHPGTVLFPVPRPKAAPSCVGSPRTHARASLPGQRRWVPSCASNSSGCCSS